MRPIAENCFGTEAAHDAPGAIEIGEGRKRRIGASVAVWIGQAGQPIADGSHVGGRPFEVAQVPIEACSVRSDGAVVEASVISENGEGQDLMAWSSRGQI